MKVYDMTHADKVIVEHPICPPLLARMGTGGNQVPLVLGSAQANAAILDDGTCPTLTAQMGTGGNNMPLVLFNHHIQDGRLTESEDVAQTISARDGESGSLPVILKTNNDQYMMTEARVRKLTPTECERLQGFSDDYTKIPWKGRPAEECPDSPRYKAIGNSWAVPCVRWIGKRIQAELEKNK